MSDSRLGKIYPPSSLLPAEEETLGGDSVCVYSVNGSVFKRGSFSAVSISGSAF
ncbi:hypothetical protein [Candidatus Endomicrobiellum agilis]|uniref:hypothetical protein n=1 Tax=Candidatus Endomicrobiellum agilis TaxID=3238957 RepID=UPI00357D3247|nr:hypothetical protein [Endomicrobium sp.]